MKTIGILGGGQLGCMLSESILKYGGTPLVVCGSGAPAIDRVANSVVGDWGDPAILRTLFDRCDRVTIEVEHVDVEALKPYRSRLTPSLDVIRTTQHRIREKQLLSRSGLPHAAFIAIESLNEANDVIADGLNYPKVLKTALGGYDGRGQHLLRSDAELREALNHLSDAVQSHGVVIEEALDIYAEASCIVAIDSAGTAVSFPVFDNDHADHVLDTTLVPTTLPASVEHAIRQIATKAAQDMNVVGLLTTEFFVTRTPPAGPSVEIDGYHLLINEFAPRPHNSGHVTRNACTLSQYDLLARILLDLPVVAPELHQGAFCMANLLSEMWGGRDELDLGVLGAHPEVVDVVLYGKKPNRSKRKMGHLVAKAKSPEQAKHAAVSCRDDLT